MPPIEEPTPPEFWYRVRSVHVSRSFPADVWYVQMELRVTSANQADSVSVTYKQSITTPLTEDDATGVWGGTNPPATVGDSHLESTPGFPWVFRVWVRDKGMYETPAVSVVRVITGTPQLSSPAHDDTVGATPELEWEAFSADFAFGFRASVYTFTETGTVSWTTPLLVSTVTSYQVPDSLALPVGDHYWTLAVVDSFENYSRSQEGWFVVTEAGRLHE